MGARSKVSPSITHFAEQTSPIKSDNHNFELIRPAWQDVNFDWEREAASVLLTRVRVESGLRRWGLML